MAPLPANFLRVWPLATAGFALALAVLVLGAPAARAETCGAYLHTAADRSPAIEDDHPRSQRPLDIPLPVCRGPKCRGGQDRPLPSAPASPTVKVQRNEAATPDDMEEAKQIFRFERPLEVAPSPLRIDCARLDRPPR